MIDLKALRNVGNLHEFAVLFGFDWDDPDWNWTWHDVAVKMADDIETWNARDERTCRNIAEEWHKQYYHGFGSVYGTAFVCSECGARLCDAEDYYAFMGVPEGDDLSKHRFEPVHYCPNCGAKVVKE